MNQTEYLLTAEEIEMIVMFAGVDNASIFEDENDLLELDEIFDEAD